MIIEFLIQLGTGVFQWAFGMLPPADDATGLIPSAGDAFGPIIAGGQAIGAWMPWGTLATVFPIVMTFYVGSFVVKVMRAAVAHLPLIGGKG